MGMETKKEYDEKKPERGGEGVRGGGQRNKKAKKTLIDFTYIYRAYRFNAENIFPKKNIT
jgi:hypothetical protein